MLQARALTRCYGEFKAVDNVSFSVETGEIVGLLGPNGAGKTTVMKILTGYLEPDAGSVTFDGMDLSSRRLDVQSRLGYLPENLPVYGELSVVDYLDYAADLKGLAGRAKRDELLRAVAATDLAGRLSDPINTLSRGLRQRVGVAQAILGSPSLVILDEPTNGLDPEQTRHMRALIADIARDATVILSTHIMQEVDALCSRALIMRAGSLALDASLHELQASGRLLLHTDWQGAEAALSALAGVSAVRGRQLQEGVFEYALQSEGARDSRALQAGVAKAVVDSGNNLYSLQREKRDLETVFRQINEGAAPGEFSDAA
ncbi:MAG: multidrug ABC transporter ATP-binding protein [Halioglobus sp.]|nr:multidrug ABC transporter ATP-binding protein [Halioglobus sp.]|tara:strand:- start:326 stop:1276 length:951 start_codon:yes stop_codon:yes gene_type:complete